MKFTRSRKMIFGVATTLVLAGCGGGGSSTASVTPSPAQAPVVVTPPVVATPPVIPTPAASGPTPVLYATSYQNAKQENLLALTMPAEANGAAAYARANFKNDGKFTLFTAIATTDSNKPLDQATPGVFAFWTQAADGSWVKDSTMIDTPVGCMIPRKAVVADLNGDGKPDVLVACHGYDAAPFPGERMYLVESTPSGVYHSHPLGDFVGFFHGASAADLDGDGLIDFVVTDGAHDDAVRAFKNNGKGSFSEMTNAMPAAMAKTGYFSVELIDLNDDGKVDLVAGGHEFTGVPTVAIYGTGAAYFSQSSITQLPVDRDAGVVLDFVKVGTKLYVGRTSGSTTDPTLFYKRLGVQTINLTTNVDENETIKDSLLFYWLLPGSTGVISDRTDRPL